jgi:hypothetical protein
MLDNAETNVCAAQVRLRAPMAGALDARTAPVPVEQLSGQKINDPARRVVLQQQLGSSIASAQEGVVNDARRDLLRYQSEYKSLTGTDLNTALCNGALPRTTHRAAAERRRDEQMQAQSARMAQDVAAGQIRRQQFGELSAACDAKKVLDLPSEAAARLYPASYLKQVRQEYAQFTGAYQRHHGTAFDPSTCRSLPGDQ